MSLEFHTNEELIDELMSRHSFKGIILHQSGESDNSQEGNGGCNIRISKGMIVQNILLYTKTLVLLLQEKWPKAFKQIFQNEI